MLLVWIAALALTLVVAWFIFQIGAVVPIPGGYAGAVVRAILAALAAGVIAAALAVFGLAMSRCTGLFGLHTSAGQERQT